MKYKVGDRIIIKDWDKMVDEYGYSGDHIDTECAFTDEMQYMCGNEYEISGISWGKWYGVYNEVWTICDDMIECLAEEIQNDDISEEVHSCVI